MEPTLPPETTSYMIAGYVVLVGGILLYLATLWLRHRHAREDWQLLEELSQRS